jgi:hypothetical protein
MWRNKHSGGFRFVAMLAALFCSAVMGYEAGIRQTNEVAGAPDKTYVLNLGPVHLTLNV